MDRMTFPNASLDLMQLSSLLDQTADTKRYPAWFTKEYRRRNFPKPDGAQVAQVAKQKFERYSLWRASVRLDMELLRFDKQGIFKHDLDAYRAGYMDDYQSIMLVEDFNHAVSTISGITPYFPVPVTNDQDAAYARQKRAAVEWLYQASQNQINRMGDQPANILHTKYMLGWGQVAKRITLNTYAETNESPFNDKFIDPTELVVDWEGERGPKRVYRRFSTTIGELCDAYGSFSEAQEKKIKNQYGSDLTDETEINDVDEYWDRVWRLVTVAGFDLLAPIEHDYGEPPFIIQPGPFGMPRSASLPVGDGWSNAREEDRRKRIQHQSCSFIHFKRIIHMQNEAQYKRWLLDEQRRQNPPIERSRSTKLTGPLRPFQFMPNDVNESELGEEDVTVLRVEPPGPSAQLLNQQQARDMSVAFASPSQHGEVNTSNLSGTAYRGALAQSMTQYQPWIGARQTSIQLESEFKLRQIRNLVDAVEYAVPGRVKPVIFPMTRKVSGEQASARLTAQLIDRVGADVQVRMTTQDKNTWPSLMPVAIGLSQQFGVPASWILDEFFQIPMDEAMREESDEEKAMRAMQEHPKFVELFVIPARIRSEIVENQGNTEYVAFLEEALSAWEQYISGPGKQEIGAQGMAQQQSMHQSMNPGTSEGVSFQDLQQGPGSVTGQMGGPRGLVGPRGPMPPQIGAG